MSRMVLPKDQELPAIIREIVAKNVFAVTNLGANHTLPHSAIAYM